MATRDRHAAVQLLHGDDVLKQFQRVLPDTNIFKAVNKQA
jgi:hypothetical protein